MSDAAPLPFDPMPPGTRLAQYEVVRTAGAGGMGVVYLARDTDLHRPVAIKVLRAAGEPPEADERFLREARSAARLNHPNVVAVYQVGRDAGRTFIAMEWVDGATLAEHLRTSVLLDWREATAAVRDAAAGLAVAHRAGVVHRDVKPANLMRAAADGTVKVADFGLARLYDAAGDLSYAGLVVGTPAYLSPEQCRGEPATPASDVYALGCTYYHLLTSQPPFPADGFSGVIAQHLVEPFPDARRIADDLPPAVLAVLDRATRKDPAERYPDAAAMGADLDAVLSDAATSPARSPDDDPDPAGVPNNLPRRTTTFVGRTRELAAVKAMLRDRRLVTLLGTGGVGKTRLSLRVAADVLGRFPDGVWFADLTGVDAADAVAGSVAAAVGVKLTGREDPAATLVGHLRTARALVVLDNCEHLPAAASAVAAAVVDGCPAVRVLATSRVPLGCPGEAEFRVPPLATPATGDVPAVDDLRQMDAVRLFADRAGLVVPAFSITPANAADVASVCRRVDGIPLALELAAARLKVLSPRQLADRLRDVLRVLAAGPPSAEGRHRTIRAMLDWSYDLLAPPERVAVARLSVFAGSCSLDAVEAVLPDGDRGTVAPADVLDLLAALVDKSLLVVEDRDGANRYRLLELVRHYAAEKLDGFGDRAAVEARHLAHHAAAAEAAHDRLFGAGEPAAVAELDADHDNIRVALDRGGGGEDAQRLTASLLRYWLHRGTVAEGLARVRAVIAAAAGRPPTRFTAGVFLNASVLAHHRGDWAAAVEYAERSLDLSRQFANRVAEARALSHMSFILKERGDLSRARKCAETSVAMRRDLGDPASVAAALNNLGLILQRCPGETDAARAAFRESGAIHHRLGDATWVAYTEMNLGSLELNAGNLAQARRHYHASVADLDGIGDAWGRAYALQGLGNCDLIAGDTADARRRLTEALAVCRRFGDRPTEAEQLDCLARVAVADGDCADAMTHAAAAYRLRRADGDDVGSVQSIETFAEVVGDADPARAAALLGGAAAVRDRVGAALYGIDADRHAAVRAALERALGPAGFAAAYEAGRGTAVDELPIPAG